MKDIIIYLAFICIYDNDTMIKNNLLCLQLTIMTLIVSLIFFTDLHKEYFYFLQRNKHFKKA